MKTPTGFLPHIEGMRALAVIAVIINHLSHDALPGGYLGVDIFFVISGFVITRSMMARPSPSILLGLAEFYERRIKRIVPALVLVVLVTLPLLRLVNPNSESATLTGLGALFGASNIFLYLVASDYFGQAITMNPFMHTWSLGVEEQFYFVFPLLFLFVAGRHSGHLRTLAIVIGVASVLSAVAYALAFETYTSAAYYLVPFRAWELGAGCLLALLPAVGHRVKPLLQALAVVLISLAFVLGNTTPVLSTFAAVLGSVALIAGGDRKTILNDALNWTAVQYVGRLSYSLYLWHWPVICLFIWTIGVSIATVLPILLLTVLLSMVSFHLIETPARRARWFSRPALSIGAGFAIAGLAAVIVMGMRVANVPAFSGTHDAVLAQDGFTPRTIMPDSRRSVGDCLGNTIGTDLEEAEQRIETCTATAPSATRLVFFGDSHALDMFGVAEVLYRKQLATVTNFGQPGCRAPSLAGEPEYCAYVQTVLDALPPEAGEGDALTTWAVLRSNYNPRVIDGSLADYMPRIDRFVADAERRGLGVIYVAPAPKFTALTKGGLCVEQWFRPAWALSERCATGFRESRQEQWSRRAGFFNALRQLEADRANLRIFDPFDVLCGNDPDACSALQDGDITYRDESHLTTAGAERMASSFVAFLKESNLLD